MKILALGNCPLNRDLGSGKTCLMWSEGLRQLGHQVDIFEPKDFELQPKFQKAKMLRQAIGAWQFLKKQRPEHYDLVEFFGDQFWLATWRLSQRTARPLLIAHTNGLELLAKERSRSYKSTQSIAKRAYELFSAPIQARASFMAFRYADAFVTLCDLDREYVLRHELFSSERAEVIPPGLDEEYLGIPFREERNDTVAYMGSWIERKGIDAISRVMTQVLRKHSNVVFHVLGTGGATSAVHASFPSDTHSQIVVHGRLSNKTIIEELCSAKVFFFPSRYEGFGMALSEALACGCAAVNTPTGFGAELQSGKEALVCDFNDETTMQQSILLLLEDDVLRSRIATAGHARVQSLRWEINVKKLEQTYLRWIGYDKADRAIAT